MENDTGMRPACADSCGTLPECAPLAVPYVPFQQMNPQKYNQSEALDNGTLFPGLNLPFHMKSGTPAAVKGPLGELQALEFVLLELGLYLDTHQEDAEAMELYRQYAAMEQQARTTYEAMHGPITQFATAGSKNWNAWLKDPWPWNYQEGGMK